MQSFGGIFMRLGLVNGQLVNINIKLTLIEPLNERIKVALSKYKRNQKQVKKPSQASIRPEIFLKKEERKLIP